MWVWSNVHPLKEAFYFHIATINETGNSNFSFNHITSVLPKIFPKCKCKRKINSSRPPPGGGRQNRHLAEDGDVILQAFR